MAHDLFDLTSAQVRTAHAGCEHSVAVDANGTLYAWGNGDAGRLGLGASISTAFTPHEVTALSSADLRVVSVAVGDMYIRCQCV